MVAINFTVFQDKIESGAKRQTIRQKRSGSSLRAIPARPARHQWKAKPDLVRLLDRTWSLAPTRRTTAMNREAIIETMAAGAQRERTSCADYDGDCYGIKDKVHCYLYDPTRGMCPFLSSHSKDVKDNGNG